MPFLLTKNSLRRSACSSRPNSSPSSAITWSSSRAAPALYPSTSMSSAPRPARWNSRSRNWAGQDRLLGHRMSTSPSLAGASGEPQSGQWVGMTKARSLPSRLSTTGPRISGITSPALRITTVSPMSTPLRTTSLALCKVAKVTVEPATRTGWSSAYGVTRPVRPTLTRMSTSRVLTSSGGYLYAIAQRGARDVAPSRRWIEIWSTLMTTPSISCSRSCRWVA